MPRYLLGQGVNLEHLVYNRDGQLADADVVFVATPASGSPVTPDVSRVSIGRYRAAMFEPPAAAVWTYTVTVSGDITDVAYGTFRVVDGSTLTTPPTGAYASQADLADILYPLPDNAEQLLVRASREVDRALLCSVYDPTSTTIKAALKTAVLEQIAGNRQDGDTTGLGGVITTATNFTIGKLSLQRASTPTTPVPRTAGLVDQAWLTLQTAGLTGQGPGEPVWAW